MKKIVALLVFVLASVSLWAQTSGIFSCAEQDKCPLQVSLTRTPNSSTYEYSVSVYVDDNLFATLSLEPSESSLDTTLLFCPGQKVAIWTNQGGEDFASTITDSYGKVTESSSWGVSYYAQDVCAQQCELILEIGANYMPENGEWTSWLELYAGDDVYPFQGFGNDGWWGGSETATISVSAGVPLRVVWHEPDLDNHSSWFNLYDPSQQRMIASKHSGDIIADGEIATYTPDCGASCMDEDRCPLQVSLTRTPNSSSYEYSVNVSVDDYLFTTLSLEPSESRLDTTLQFCSGRRVAIWTNQGGEDFAGTITDSYGKVTESSSWGVSYYAQDVCAQQCELILEIGANYMPENGEWTSWLELYAGDDVYPFQGFGNDGWWGGSETATISVSAGVPLRVVWHEPDPDNHSGWFNLYDPSQQRMIASKYSGDIIADGEIATYTPDCGASCMDEDRCPLQVSLIRTPNSSSYEYSVNVFVDDYLFTTLSLEPSESRLDTTLLFCSGRRVEIWTNQGGEDFAGTITDSYGNVTESSSWGVSYYAQDVCAQQCELILEIGANYMSENGEWTSWLELYAGDDVYPFQGFGNDGWWGGSETVTIPVSAGVPLRVVWHEPDLDNHSSWFNLYDPSQQRMIASKYSGDIIADGEIATYTPDCGASCIDENRCPLEVSLTRTPNSSSYEYSVNVFVDDYLFTTLSLEPSESSLDTTLLFCSERRVAIWTNQGGDDFTMTVTDAYGNVTEYNGYMSYNNENICVDTTEVIPDSVQIVYITTNSVTDITVNSAVCGGVVSSEYPIFAYGICWSTEPNPTIAGQHTIDGTVAGSFSSILNGLTENTTYYVRAYATNAAGTSYGEEMIFTTMFDYHGIIYVTQTGAGMQTGENWENAVSSISDAQTLALVHNAVVWVAAGTYYGDTLSENAFTMRDGVNVYGGFAGNEPADYNLSQRDFEANATILDGQDARRVLNQPLDFSNETMWDGFTIQNGYTISYGGGANLKGNGMLRCCRISNNIASTQRFVDGDAYGGGVYADNATVSHCQISNNTAKGTCYNSYGFGFGYGGGVYANNAKVSNCQISNNTANGIGYVFDFYSYNSYNKGYGYGGGVYAKNTTVSNCQISNNIANGTGYGYNCYGYGYGYGGGVYANNAMLSNCQISNNTANGNGYRDNYGYGEGGNGHGYGGGVYAYNTSSVINSTIVNNTSQGVYGGSDSVFIKNCIVWGNSSSFSGDPICTYTAVEGGYMGEGNVLLDEYEPFLPMFANPSLTVGASDSTQNVDWHLMSGSICVNHGSNAVVADSLDLDGTARIKRDTVDMGCYESDYYSSVPLTEYNNIIYVTTTGAGTQSGDSWANATSSIEEAQSLAEMYHAVVWVAAGTYYGDTISVAENTFTMRDGVSVYGGFAGNEAADYDLSQRDFEANATILDGRNERRVLYQPSDFNTQTVWDGFTIQNGLISGSGAGAYLCRNAVLRYCIVTGNLSTNGIGGGGVYATNATIEHCYFNDNATSGIYGGGGLYAGLKSTISNCRISNNTSNGSGGGVFVEGTTVMNNCQISNNISSYGGGGVYASDNSTITNCQISNNTSNSDGGGVRAIYNSSITGSTIVRNSSANNGGGVYGYGIAVTNCIIWGNEGNGTTDNIYNATCTYSAVEDHYLGEGNTVLNDMNLPLFVNPSLTAGASDTTANMDWHLQNGSVCVNRGNNAVVTDSLDLDGTARIKRDTVDLGCYESDYYSVPITEYEGIIYVTQTGAGTHSGDSWANAISSIEEAQSLAEMYHAVVWVAAGTYYGDTLSENAFTMRDGVSLYGGFAGNEPANYDLSQRDFEANTTILDGMNARRVLNQPSNFNAETKWDGFTIQKGQTSGNGAGVYMRNHGHLSHCKVQSNVSTNGNGGGVYCSNAVVEECDIVENTCRNSGGGIYIQSSSIVSDCRIVDNTTTSSQGGGVYSSSSTVTECLIKGNTSYSYGGGVHIVSSTIRDCNILENTSNNRGGGVNASSGNIISCQISHNQSSNAGGGLYISSSTQVRNCLVDNNSAGLSSSYGGGGIYGGGTVVNTTIVRNSSSGNGAGISGSASTNLKNCIVWGNKRNGEKNNISGNNIVCVNSAIEDGYSGTDLVLFDNSINNPLFVNPSLTAGASDSTVNVDWHLQNGSVCVNRGDNSAITDTIDLDGNVRIQRDTVDLGCYESDYYSVPMTMYDSIIYVTQAGAGNRSGNSWENAIPSIEEAQVLAQVYNAVVWVATGTYYGDTTAANAFTMIDGVNVYGGFAGNEPADYDLSQRDFEANTTILDGMNARRVLKQPSSFNTQTTWNGFALQNGQTSGNGGGAYLQNKGVLSQCEIMGCNANGGGGVYVSAGTISECLITDCTASNGGGVNCTNKAVISSCRIAGNNATGAGGGVYTYNSTIVDCDIIDNETSGSGGGVYCYYSTHVLNTQVSPSDILRCIISGNHSSNSGGGVCFGFANDKLNNCLVSNNSSNTTGGGVFGKGRINNTTIVRNYSTGEGGGLNAGSYNSYYSGNIMALNNCVVWGNVSNGGSNNIKGSSNTCTCSYSAIEEGYSGTGNILLDEINQPHFVNPAHTAGFDDSTDNVDWHLQQASVCINRGDNSAVTDTLDLDGNARIQRDTVDMGCYESDYYSVPMTEYDSIIYVTVTGAGTQLGNSWANATSSIEEAQTLAQTYGAVVWVAAGTYYGDTVSTSNNAFTMVDGVNVYGGFAGNEPADYDLSQRDFEANATILDGQNARRVLNQPSSFNAQTTWNGFVMQNGQTSGNGGGAYLQNNGVLSQCKIIACMAPNGGGVYNSRGTISECIISSCSANEGGGVNCTDNATISSCILSNNNATTGGGVFSYNSSIVDCDITMNAATGSGGGVYCYYRAGLYFYVDPTNVIRCRIVGNQASNGGGIWLGYGNDKVQNCLVSNNTANMAGGGIIGNGHVYNTTIVRNTSTDDGAGVNGSTSTTLTNCIVWGNERNGDVNNLNGSSIVCSYSAIEGGYTGDSIIVLNDINRPLFVNPSLTAGANDSSVDVDWHLQQGSVCVNRGNNSVVTDTLDLDGTARIKRDTVDMGCYESDYYSIPVTGYNSIIYVTVTGAGTQSGDSWANATSSIDEAQTLAQTYDAVVWVAAGTYYGDTTANAFTMHNGVNVYGGFAGDEPADYDLSQRDFETNTTILDGQNERRVLYQPDNFGTQTVWDGFTIRNGNTTEDGGGAYLRVNSLVSHCVFRDNVAQGTGGGLSAWLNTGNCWVKFCEFMNNTSNSYGGGIYAYTFSACAMSVSNCLVANNSSLWAGGGINTLGSGWSNVNNTTIVRNTSGSNNGVVSQSTLTNCIVWGNLKNGATDILNNAIRTYSAIEGGYGGEGNIDLGGNISPRFVNPSLTAGASDSTQNVDWHLQNGSPCINHGNNEAITDTLDLDGQPRVQQGVVDMGCYETQYTIIAIPVTVAATSNNSSYGVVSGSGMYSQGDTVTLQAIPSSNTVFLRWSDNDTTNPRYVVAESDTAFEAIFELYLPELHVTSIDHSAFIGGQQATISWTVQNDGIAPTPNGEVWYDRVWLSVESRVAAGDNNPILLGTFPNVSALDTGDYYTQTQTVDIPLTLAGEYFLFVITDAYDAHHIYWDGEVEIPYNPPAYIGALTAHGPGSRIMEMSEYYNSSSWHDNFFYELVDIAVPLLPDLVVTHVAPSNYPFLTISELTQYLLLHTQMSQISLNFYSGSEVTLSYRVLNDGNYDTRVSDWRDAIFISNHSEFDETAQALNVVSHSGLLLPDSSYLMSTTVRIPLEIYDTAYFYVYTDFYDQVYEHVGRYNNVTRSGAVNIILSPPADLIPRNITADNTVSTGAFFTFSYEVKNQGAGDPNHSSWADRCYLSTSPTALVNEVPIATDQHYNGLAAGDSYSIQHSITLPSSITSGTYYLFVHADYQNNVFEYLYDDNNLRNLSHPITVVQPDLQILSLNVADTLSAGAEVGVSYQLANTGDGGIVNRNVKDGFYLSQSPDGSNPIQLPQFTANTWLNAHDSTTKYQNVQLPNDLQDGIYYLFAVTNIDNALNEANISNNRSPIQQVYINHRPLPDLVITSVVLPDTIIAGNSITMLVNFTNQGEIAAALGNLTFQLMAAGPNNNIDCSVGNVSTNIQSLEVGGTATATIAASISPAISSNPASFTLTVNPNYAITESNYSNNGYAVTHDVQPYPFDLAVTELDAPDQIVSGEYINVEWTVQNQGSVPTLSLPMYMLVNLHVVNFQSPTLNQPWYDWIYLSEDSLFDANDTQIGNYARSQTLLAGNSYTANMSCRIPVAADGDYYVLVVNDATQVTFDCQRANNTAAHPIAVTQSALPDLRMDTLIALNTLTSGEMYTLRYTVSNVGEHVTHDNRWTDAFYLNQSPNLNGAVQLGSKIHNGQLDTNAQYVDSLNVILPNNWSGDGYLIGFTDATDQIVEMNSNANNLKITPVSVSLPLPCDLTVTQPDFPQSAIAGENISVSWTVRNIGANTAQGNIKDAVYLSTDSVWSSDDIMLGSVQYAVNIPANGQQQQSSTLPLQGVPIGDYYVVVKTNILNALNENSYTNNKVVSLTTINVDYPSLYIDQEEQRQLAQNQTVYYKLQIGPEYEHQTLSCKLTAANQNVANSLYIAYASAPSASHFDWSATIPYVREQEILIPSLEQGTYYIMANGQTSNNSSQSVTLLASIIHFEIISVNTDRGTNAGSVTTQILGAKFDTIMDFRLANSNGYLPAEKIFFNNSTETYATFNLRDQETGVYDMVAELPGGIITVKGQAFVVEPGLPAELLSNIIAPASVRQGNTFTVTIEYGNNGSTDLNISGFLLVSTNGFPIAFTSDSLVNNATELTFETGEPHGNPDVMRPGYFATKTIFVKANRVGNINLKLYPIRRQY